MTVGNTLLSGVNLEGGKLGYDTKKITSSKTWTSAGINIAAGTITGGIKMSGMSTSLVNGVAGGLSGGITTGDWKGSMVDSMRNSAAGYLGGNLGGGNDALTNVSSMLFRKMLGSKEDFSWDTVAQNDAIGKLVGGYLNEMLMSDEQRAARAADEQKRQQEQGSTAQGFKFMNMFENTIGGFFSRLGEDMNALASDVGNAASGVKSAWGSIKSGAEAVWSGIKNTGSVIADVGKKIVNNVGGLFDSEDHQKAVRGNLDEIKRLIANNGVKPIGTVFIDRTESGWVNKVNNSNSQLDVNDPVVMQKIRDGKLALSQVETNTNENKGDSFFGKIGNWIKDSAVGKFVSDWVVDPVVNAAKGIGSLAKEWIVDPIKTTYNDAKQWLADSAVGKFASKAIDFVKETVDSVKKVWNDFERDYPSTSEGVKENIKAGYNNKDNLQDLIKGNSINNEEARHKRDGSLKNNISEKDIKSVEKKTFYLFFRKKI